MSNCFAINLRSYDAKQVMERLQSERWLTRSQYLFEALIRAGCTPTIFARISHEWFLAYIQNPPVPLDRIMIHLKQKWKEFEEAGSRRRRWIRLLRRHFAWFYAEYGERIRSGVWRPPLERRTGGRLLEEKWRELEQLRVELSADAPWGLGTRVHTRMREQRDGKPLEDI